MTGKAASIVWSLRCSTHANMKSSMSKSNRPKMYVDQQQSECYHVPYSLCMLPTGSMKDIERNIVNMYFGLVKYDASSEADPGRREKQKLRQCGLDVSRSAVMLQVRVNERRYDIGEVRASYIVTIPQTMD